MAASAGKRGGIADNPDDIDWDNFDEATILGKIRGFKGHLKKSAVTLTSLLHRETYENGLEENNALKETVRNMALDAMETEPPAPVPTQAPLNPAGQDFKKTNEGLKPTTLSHEDTPEQLRSWERMWSSFYTTGNLHSLRLEDQQAWLLSVVDKFLAGRLESRMTVRTPIFHDPKDPTVVSCLGIISEEFLRRYPIAARRHQFFSYKPTKGMPMSSLDDTLSNMARNADIKKMTEEEHLALRIVTACQDEGLKREFLKLRIMSLVNVRNTYESWEQQLNTLSAIQPTYAQTAQSASPARQQQQQRNGQRRSTSNSNRPPAQRLPTPHQDKLRQKLAGLCLRCAARDHITGACPHKDSLSCNSCKKSGHLQNVCFAAARAADLAAVTPGARSVRSVDELEQLHISQASSPIPAPQQQLALEFAGSANAISAIGPAGGPSRATPFVPL